MDNFTIPSLRDTPTTSPADKQDLLDECQAVGAIQVPPETMVAMLLHHAPENNCSPLDMLVMIEDYTHGCVIDGICWIVPNYLPQA